MFEAAKSGVLAILDVSPVVNWEHPKHEPAGGPAGGCCEITFMDSEEIRFRLQL